MGKGVEVDAKFVERLQRAMGDAKLNQPQLAERIGVSKAAINGWLLGKAPPAEANIRSAARALGVRAEWLASGEEPMLPDEIEPTEEERDLIKAWRKLPPSGRELYAPLIRWSGEQQQPPLADLTQRRAARADHVLVRLVGTVAAREETAAIDFDTRTGDETEVPAELVGELLQGRGATHGLRWLHLHLACLDCCLLGHAEALRLVREQLLSSSLGGLRHDGFRCGSRPMLGVLLS
jgi:transcriptional regulator with XRE-family HTH domain